MSTELMAFPEPPETMQLALVNLALLGRGGEGAAGILASGEFLPRPWDITTIADVQLRHDTWQWLKDFVGWLNSQHAWFSRDLTPPCWASHPSLIHQLGTLAATRYEAGESTNSAAMEEWHRFALPNYLERTREQRLGCEDRHQAWPARAAFLRSANGSSRVIPAGVDSVPPSTQRPATAPSRTFTDDSEDPTVCPLPLDANAQVAR